MCLQEGNGFCRLLSLFACFPFLLASFACWLHFFAFSVLFAIIAGFFLTTRLPILGKHPIFRLRTRVFPFVFRFAHLCDTLARFGSPNLYGIGGRDSQGRCEQRSCAFVRILSPECFAELPDATSERSFVSQVDSGVCGDT